ncbi:hypothetical protein [Actibacterium sp. XHP0104]|uniref:hypothetical protein n=1 Tax=Actibacterium sp. XHP0104 TaxID=2984335 RepID=UPI0021E8151C|nr:hypothetical protein [Actibacterium sp. XHP0104]MCV2881074.1 hypothetical protein [Actibacterium sp. XHP0104]
MNRLAKKITSEPIGLLGLAVAILALLPAYWTLLSDSNYTFSFQCSEIGPESGSLLIDGGVHTDFVAVHTRCDFSNLDNQTISVKRASASASFEGFRNENIEFDAPFKTAPFMAQYQPLGGNTAHAVSAGETLLFDEFYMIPIDRSWAENQELCSDIHYDEITSFRNVANCIPDLRSECLETYLDEMNFLGGAGGSKPYRALAILVTLGNDTFARAPMSLPWYWRPFPDTPFDGSRCPNPNKTDK